MTLDIKLIDSSDTQSYSNAMLFIIDIYLSDLHRIQNLSDLDRKFEFRHFVYASLKYSFSCA